MGYVDYDRGTGTTGVMKTRVWDGSVVEFYLNSGQSSTWFGSRTFSYSSPNGSGSWNQDYPAGSGWKLMGTIYVTSSGNVSWTVPATGTQGVGGPTTHTVYVQRAVVPAAPTPLGIDELTHNSFRFRFSGNSDGGSPIREWQIGYGQDPNSTQYYTGSSGTTTIGVISFMPGTDVYAWARGRNDVGWGPWSSRSSGRLLPGIKVKVGGVWKNAILHVKVNGQWRPAVLYAKRAGAWRETVY